MKKNIILYVHIVAKDLEPIVTECNELIRRNEMLVSHDEDKLTTYRYHIHTYVQRCTRTA